MAYFIFLKYLRSLEEFRKNPHAKILPKSPCANFQSLGIFKILIFIQKRIFFGFWPIRPGPAPPPRRPAMARRPRAPRSAHSAQATLAYFLKGVFSLTIVHSGRDAFSLSRHCHVGPACQLHPLPHAGRPLPLLLVASGYPTPPGLQPRDAKRGLHSPP
jgi:hypothetical protein